MSANTYGRQVVLPLTNKSGGGVIAGDVVILDSTTNDAFTTTTSANSTVTVGVAQETIASNAVGRVLFGGYAALVNVNASVTRLHYGATFTVAKQATDAGASRTAGTFCVFLSSGATPDAYVYPVDLAGAALTNPMSAQDDMIIGGAAGTPARLAAAGAPSKFLQTDGSNHVVWGAGSGLTPGQTNSYPTTFTGDTINGSSATPFADVAAFDTKEVLNSRILHLRTLGASKDQRVRVTLGTTKAAAFDVTVCVVWNGQRWSSSMDTYGEVRLSTAADGQLCIARYGMQAGVTDWGIRVGGATISTAADTLEPRFYLGQTITLRFVRDGSNVISYQVGLGTAPMALVPILGYNVGGVDIPYTQTVAGTLARIEFATHTPSGPNASAAIDTYVDYLASV